jgi:hypothetical protein
LAALHDRFVADHRVWRDRVEVLYPPADELAGFRQQAATRTVASPGEQLHRIAVSAAWTTNLYLAAAEVFARGRRRRGGCQRSPTTSSSPRSPPTCARVMLGASYAGFGGARSPVYGA